MLSTSCGSSLKTLSLIDNAVVLSAHYRLYTIFKIPSLKILDYRKITKKEREEAGKFFATQHGENMLQNIENERQQRAAGTYGGASKAAMVLTEEQKYQVKKAIEKATTKEQIDYIEKQLKVSPYYLKYPHVCVCVCICFAIAFPEIRFGLICSISTNH